MTQTTVKDASEDISRTTPGSKIGKINIKWKDLSYSLRDAKKKTTRTILHPQDGETKPGDLLALMGPSGSGKTSLLNSLAGRLPSQKGAQFAGEILVNELPIQKLPCPFADISAYVEQEDVLYALSTCYETLVFQSKLRLPKNISRNDIEERIDAVLRQLGLLHVKHTNVGGSSFNGAIRGLSGGERKRLSIALELMHNPKVLFLDEPTTGLDSYQALNVMEKLRELADAQQTVVVSIHQPRSSIFAMLTGVYILAGGKPVFAGPVDAATEHFAMHGFPLPPLFNPADFFIDLVSVDQRGDAELAASTKRLEGLCDVWEANELKRRHQKPTGAIRKSFEETCDDILAAKPEAPAGQSTVLMPFYELMKRGWREQTRDKAAMGLKWCFNLFFTAIFGLVYFRLGHSQQSVQDRTGILFFLTMNQAFGAVIGCAQAIPRQLVVVNRERSNRLYPVFPFYLSTLACMVALEAIPQFVNNVVIFYMTNLGGSVWLFFAILGLENLAGISLGVTLSACFTNVTMAAQIAPAVVILFLMFSGFLINENSVPVYFIWLKEISFIRYAFKAAAVNEFDGANFECDLCPAGSFDQDDDCDLYCVTEGEQILRQLKFDQENLIFTCCMILIAIAVVFNLLAIVILMLRYPKFLPLQSEGGPKMKMEAGVGTTEPTKQQEFQAEADGSSHALNEVKHETI